MIRFVLPAALAAMAFAGPVHADDSVKNIVGGIARQYLEQEQDRAAFAQAQGQNTLTAYRSYLSQFPNGAYASQARAQVERLGGTTTARSAGQSGGEASGLSAKQRVSVQRRLTALGYDTSGTDGSFGPGTRRAIALWQRDRNYAQTGSLSTAQTNELLRGTTPATSTQAGSAPLDGPAQVEAGLGLTRQQRGAVQAGLTQRGFDTRGVDGSFGPGTRNAIGGWQRANDQTVTGYLTAAQAQRLIGG